MAKISANGSHALVRATREREPSHESVTRVRDTLVLCSDARVLVKTDVRHGERWSYGTYKVKMRGTVTRDPSKLIPAFVNLCARIGYVPTVL